MPARLSALVDDLEQIEASGVFTNFGPVNKRFEQAMVAELFGGVGQCLTVSNATIGLLLAIRDAIGANPERRRYALMPSFTFAATAHVALWNGLTPLLCDIDAETWAPSAEAEEALLERHGDEIAVVTPYAAFGNCLDLTRYEQLSRRYDVPVVIDAAGSLGSRDDSGRGFGAGFAPPVVFSMHTTKAFATSEGGLIYSADAARIERLRAMSNFGFAEPRIASLPGLNAKLPEVCALLGLAKLDGFEAIVARREQVFRLYQSLLPQCTFQRRVGQDQAHAFVPALLPDRVAHRRPEVMRFLADRGVAAGTYFSPHLAEHPFFQTNCVTGDLATTQRIAPRIVVLPISDVITEAEVEYVCRTLTEACA
jgi:dTDP-4-amino-4,6-dideoxygalactose transaminase